MFNIFESYFLNNIEICDQIRRTSFDVVVKFNRELIQLN